MADEREAFLTAIRADLNGPTTYLVFADWLDDRAEHREAQFYRSVGRHLESHHRLPVRYAHWLPAGQAFSDDVYADNDRFVVSRHHSTGSAELIAFDLNDLLGGRGLARRHRQLHFTPVLSVSQHSDRLPQGVEWDRLIGDVSDGAEFVGTFGDRVKCFTNSEALVNAMAAAFQPDEPAPSA